MSPPLSSLGAISAAFARPLPPLVVAVGPDAYAYVDGGRGWLLSHGVWMPFSRTGIPCLSGRALTRTEAVLLLKAYGMPGAMAEEEPVPRSCELCGATDGEDLACDCAGGEAEVERSNNEDLRRRHGPEL